MRATFDTNILVRAVMLDDPGQAEVASRLLRESELIALPLACLCEFVWVLRRVYKMPDRPIANALRRLLDSSTVITDRTAAEAGLALLNRGGDFADGVIEFEGRGFGAETFLSFDRDVVRLLDQSGLTADVPS